MADAIANMFLINAPAGSGKSTYIEETVLNLLSQHNPPRILCITYTNRAADELSSRISSPFVTVNTIHSFIADFISVYFKRPDIVELYFEVYGDEIKKSLVLTNDDGTPTDRNARFAERVGEPTFDAVRANITEIKYNELQFNSLYYGGLSHDDLLSFTNIVFQKYPILRKRLVDKYSYIFIDEYQDTSDSVLFTFFDAVKDTLTRLYILGDKMQQIYENYRGDFEPQLKLFSTEISLNKNYRSSQPIVAVLNNLYNDKNYIQHADNQDDFQGATELPTMRIIDAPEKVLQEKLLDEGTLKLLIFNRSRFEAIDAGNLYSVVSKMKSYQTPSKYTPVHVLTDLTTDNPDELFRKFYHIISIASAFKNRAYGLALQAIKKSNVFIQEPFAIMYHKDKLPFTRNMKYLCNKLFFEKNVSLKEFIDFCVYKGFIVSDSFAQIINNEEYNEVLSVQLKEIINVYRYLDNPHISTQHGVKGEGHDSVYFFAEDSSQPVVRMYEFFRLLACSGIDVNLTDFQNTYYRYSRALEPAEKICPMPPRKMKAEQFEAIEPQLTKIIKQLYNDFEDNSYFKYLMKADYEKYISKPNVSNLRLCLSTTKIRGILAAYKLFYVGCSRAKKSLSVAVDKKKIEKYAEAFVKKMQTLGFEMYANDKKIKDYLS